MRGCGRTIEPMRRGRGGCVRRWGGGGGGGELVAEDEGAAGEEAVEDNEALEGDGEIAGGAEACVEGGRGGEAGAVAASEAVSFRSPTRPRSFRSISTL